MRSASLAFVIALVAGSNAALAATHCVNPAGSGSCLATIQAAVDAAAGGDTISIRAGEYFEGVNIPAGKDGLTLVGAGRRTVIDAEGSFLNAITVNSANVTIRRLRIRNGTGAGIESNAAGTQITRVVITGTASDCVTGNGDNISIERSFLYSCGDEMIVITGIGATIANNRLEGGDNGGIDVYGDGALVEGNVILGAEDDDCIYVSGNGAEVVNNRAIACDGEGVEVSGDSPVVSGNRTSSSDGIYVYCATCTAGEVRGNSIREVSDDDGGFDLEVTGMEVIGNRSHNTADEGLYVVGNGNVIRRNRIDLVVGDSYESCAYVEGSTNEIAENRFSRCNDAGVEIGGDGNILTANRVVRAGTAGFELMYGNTNDFRRNAVRSANGAAFEVGGGATGTTFSGNSTGRDVRHQLCDMGIGTTAGNDFSVVATSGCDVN